MTDGPRYAWCFDHGSLHHFTGEPWCTATWAPLAGDTETEALADKTTHYGNAIFYDDLTWQQEVHLGQTRDQINLDQEQQ